jgi:predicted PurR-regulated permease PerM
MFLISSIALGNTNIGPINDLSRLLRFLIGSVIEFANSVLHLDFDVSRIPNMLFIAPSYVVVFAFIVWVMNISISQFIRNLSEWLKRNPRTVKRIFGSRFGISLIRWANEAQRVQKRRLREAQRKQRLRDAEKESKR